LDMTRLFVRTFLQNFPAGLVDDVIGWAFGGSCADAACLGVDTPLCACFSAGLLDDVMGWDFDGSCADFCAYFPANFAAGLVDDVMGWDFGGSCADAA
jgi:hypothetical protein